MGALAYLLILFGCKQQQVGEVRIADDLFNAISYHEYSDLKEGITKSLNGDSTGLKQLILYDCGGGALCYDLGYVISQIAYRTSESAMIKMATYLDGSEKKRLFELISAGLEYGDNNYDGIADKLTIVVEFPELSKQLMAHQ